MEYDKDKVDEMVPALLFLTLHGDGRSWKGHDWDAMDRLYQKGLIFDPVGKSVAKGEDPRWRFVIKQCLQPMSDERASIGRSTPFLAQIHLQGSQRTNHTKPCLNDDYTDTGKMPGAKPRIPNPPPSREPSIENQQ
jgi:hypothetical protein